MREITEREKEIASLREEMGLFYREIGVRFNISISCATQIYKNMLRKWRKISGAIVVSTAGGTSRHLGEKAADWSVTGVPVISVVVPTVLQTKLLKDKIDDLLTVCHIQDAIGTASALIAYALVKISYPTLSQQDCIEAVRLRQTVPVNW